jgi:hypothetical protein
MKDEGMKQAKNTIEQALGDWPTIKLPYQIPFCIAYCLI